MRNLHGLYVITDSRLLAGRLQAAVEAALRGGARLVQYRDKQLNAAMRREEAGALLTLCRHFDVPLIINDDAQLAADIGADGVHLGEHDLPVSEARRMLGPQAIIGRSCYQWANAPGLAGADYAAFGRFYPSQTKPEAAPADIRVLHQARQQLDCPIVAIGGITADNGAPLIAAGADMLAVVGGVFDQPDIEAAARRLAGLFD